MNWSIHIMMVSRDKFNLYYGFINHLYVDNSKFLQGSISTLVVLGIQLPKLSRTSVCLRSSGTLPLSKITQQSLAVAQR